MTLVTRTSLFFLAALAVVLVGLSAAIYGLMRYQLLGQLTAGATNVAENLVAAVEIAPDGLEWEPGSRQFALQKLTGEAPVLWGVLDEDGKLLEGSITPELLSAALTASGASGSLLSHDQQIDTELWRIVTVRIQAQNPISQTMLNAAPTTGEVEPQRHQAMTIATASPLGPAYATLRMMALLLIAISFGIWALAALAGRWLCAKALAPVARMAQAVGTISAADLTQRLPPAETGDELERLGIAFNDLLTRLQDSFERQKRFTAEASHQLRTPLTAMIGQLDVALRRDRSEEEYRCALKAVHQQSAKLRQIVEMLLFLSREGAEARPPDLEQLELRSWLADYLQSWSAHSRFPDMHYELESGDPICIRAHHELLGEAINNLLDNACKYSEPGTPIRIGVKRSAAGPRLAVADRGIGISPQELPQVFDPFFRSEETRRRGANGIGLGLAVARRILSVFNAQVTVQSAAGEGSQFIVTFPPV